MYDIKALYEATSVKDAIALLQAHPAAQTAFLRRARKRATPGLLLAAALVAVHVGGSSLGNYG